MTVRAFYDDLAPWYHLIFEDWDASIDRQSEALNGLISQTWGAQTNSVLDVAAGIGTQAIGLASLGYRLTLSDISMLALQRARLEASQRNLTVDVLCADMRRLPVRAGLADVVISCDNALPHLLTDDAIRSALTEWYRCLRPGGGCLITMRDYTTPPPSGTEEEHPYGQRMWAGRSYDVKQIWSWHGNEYDITFVITDVDQDAPVANVTTRYYAIPPNHITELMIDVGFTDVWQVDQVFYQPVLLGTRSD